MSLDHPKLISLPTYFATKLDDIKTACVYISLTLSYLNEGTNPVKKTVPSMYLTCPWWNFKTQSKIMFSITCKEILLSNKKRHDCCWLKFLKCFYFHLLHLLFVEPCALSEVLSFFLSWLLVRMADVTANIIVLKNSICLFNDTL